MLLSSAVIHADELLVVKSRELSYSTNPLPESPIADFYKNKSVVVGSMQFQDSYAPVIVYWGNETTKKLAGFTYLRLMGTGSPQYLAFTCHPVQHNNETFYLLIGKSKRLENLYSIVLSIIKTRDRNFDIGILDSLKGDDALVAYHTAPVYYNKMGLRDYRGDEVVAQINKDMMPHHSAEPKLILAGATLKISLKEENLEGKSNPDAEFEYNFTTKQFKYLGE